MRCRARLTATMAFRLAQSALRQAANTSRCDNAFFLQRFQQAVGYGAPAVDSRDYRISKYGAAKVEEGEKRADEIRAKHAQEKRAALEGDAAEWSKRVQLEAWRTAGTMSDADRVKMEDYKHLYAKTVTLEKLGQEVDVSQLKGDGKVSQVWYLPGGRSPQVLHTKRTSSAAK